jgi:hypothetical protein
VNHIPDTGKMVSDTPRTDAAKFWSDIGGWVTPASKFMELERELNAANERIKRMESFINRFLDPEDLGYAVNNYVRDDAREALGRERVEYGGRKAKP